MLKKIDLISEKKINNKTLEKIKGGHVCARCICGTKVPETWEFETTS